jgi:DNA-binding helix-hairpin-helix protein with protein kinase domain
MPHKNPEARAAYIKEWRERTREQRLAKQAAYNAGRKEVISAQGKARYEANREHVRAVQKEYRAKNKDKLRAHAKAYYEANKELCKEQASVRGRKYRMDNAKQLTFRGAKDRAAKRGIECTISFEEIVWPELCPVFGIPLTYYGRGARESRASLDRLDNSKGYVAGNVRVISLRANRIKSDATLAELEAIMQYMKNANVLS